MKDCKIIFRDNQLKPYEFASADLQKALEWAQDKPVQAIVTPWGVLQMWTEEDYEKAMLTFN